MKNKIVILVILVIILGGCINESKEEKIVVFAGAASKPALEKVSRIFEEKTGIGVELNFGVSESMLLQMKMAKKGDIYIPGYQDYMIKAKRENIIYPETERVIAYLIPAINVQSGNPKNITSLNDLGREGIKVGICNPESCCVGRYAVEILEYNNLTEKVKKNIITYAESCPKTASLVALDKVDAIIGWRAFGKWNPDDIDIVYIEKERIPRISYISSAISVYTKDKESAHKFIDFLVSEDGRKIFAEYGYIADEDEARKYAPNARIGGEYELPREWK
ncbi:MAG TPA: molybdate ABC transporter substrate-binding protein [Candidatus Altiarchaeales archaeon]|nr:molybdate ABC transporter substrate-binding protein [Candidatus Altiarchaeales archaeon]